MTDNKELNNEELNNEELNNEELEKVNGGEDNFIYDKKTKLNPGTTLYIRVKR